MMIRMVGGWMFLLVPAHPGSPGQRAVKRLSLLLLYYVWKFIVPKFNFWLSFQWLCHFKETPSSQLCIHVVLFQSYYQKKRVHLTLTTPSLDHYLSTAGSYLLSLTCLLNLKHTSSPIAKTEQRPQNLDKWCDSECVPLVVVWHRLVLDVFSLEYVSNLKCLA